MGNDNISERITALEKQLENIGKDLEAAKRDINNMESKVMSEVNCIKEELHEKDLDNQSIKFTLKSIDDFIVDYKKKQAKNEDNKWKIAPIILSALMFLSTIFNLTMVYQNLRINQGGNNETTISK